MRRGETEIAELLVQYGAPRSAIARSDEDDFIDAREIVTMRVKIVDVPIMHLTNPLLSLKPSRTNSFDGIY